ncbi:hypothetical protein FD29_GL002178 [Companilactobacillus mindensis DSM 14500]|uniref:Uncharacterized protein n=1 Tax=Companilactobacillus mindensis DSM 14500 TaxID=1423770 RepID=A0A0R1QP30_9LACO|nr:hypothetical protein [Companilactobacillus mindensis]KRL44452.1 hypothetical protein FD29_GL002178 [Companilactobacillus mindensis DSM 14500]GEO79208.1 ABC transporter permease [Companilactobacillus mindensis]
MNKRQLKALFAVDLRLLNPQVTDRYRKKGKTGTVLTKKLQQQFLINTLVFMMIYGFMMLSMDFSKLPGMFTFYTLLFILLGFSQSISGIYNIFFAGKDLNSYLPLPFRQKEIFFSKMLIVCLNIIPFTLPMFIVFFMTSFRAGVFVLIAFLVSIVAYLVILGIVLFFCSLIVFALTKTKVFQKHQNIVMNAFIAISTIIAVGGILLTNNSGTKANFDRPAISFLLPLFHLIKEPFAIKSLLVWLVLIVLLVAFGIPVKYVLLPHLSEQLTQVNTAALSQANKHKRVRKSGLKQNLDSYNLRLLQEPNLLLQVVMNSVMIPLIFIFSFAFAKVPSNLSLKWLGVFFVAGIFYSTFTTNQAALISNLISLDRMNLEFVRTLPISMSQYLKRKFVLGYRSQLLINVVLILIMALVLKLNLLMLLAVLLGNILGTYLVCLYYFSRDYRLRLTNWTNITELFNRGGGNLGMVTSMFVSIIIGTAVIVAYAVAIYFVPQTWLVNGIVFILLIIGSWLIYRHYQQKFWRQFE